MQIITLLITVGALPVFLSESNRNEDHGWWNDYVYHRTSTFEKHTLH